MQLPVLSVPTQTPWKLALGAAEAVGEMAAKVISRRPTIAMNAPVRWAFDFQRICSMESLYGCPLAVPWRVGYKARRWPEDMSVELLLVGFRGARTRAGRRSRR